MDSLEVALHGQCRARPSLGRVLLSHHLHQRGVQVLQLLMESSAEFAAEERSAGKRLRICWSISWRTEMAWAFRSWLPSISHSQPSFLIPLDLSFQEWGPFDE
ncbi:hypothetical protein Cadr_000015558 [Camelus dromedarius]|uniref:Uncharacterized protein n=1 Tax=Camelus dromedarius TaxID=9838 RepID=A0A5N4EBD2_CAMDR|nr:hypothetical protein Cadr_000015558 [Camelus dromedarius]